MADNRARKEIGETCHEERIIKESGFLHLPSVGIGEVGDLVKGEETDSERKDQMQQGIVRIKKPVHIGDEKISVFKIPQKGDIGGYTENENHSSACRETGIKFQERRPYKKIEEQRTEEKIKMGRMRPTIKEKRSENEPDLWGLSETIPYQGKVDNQGDREKYKQIQMGIKKHEALPADNLKK